MPKGEEILELLKLAATFKAPKLLAAVSQVAMNRLRASDGPHQLERLLATAQAHGLRELEMAVCLPRTCHIAASHSDRTYDRSCTWSQIELHALSCLQTQAAQGLVASCMGSSR